MLVLGIETSCDETGVALYDTDAGLLGHVLHTQAAMHELYGGVVPELASRDHVRRLLPLIDLLFKRCAADIERLREVKGHGDGKGSTDIEATRNSINYVDANTNGINDVDDKGNSINYVDAVAYTRGPGLAGALLVGAATANALAFALGKPAIGVHHLEGHLLSPLLAEPRPRFPFIALLVSGGHSQIMRVAGVGQYETLGDTLDDAAGEAFDKTAKLLGLGYPGGPALAKLAVGGDPTRYKLPRPLINSGDLDFSFSGLKTAVRTLIERELASSEDAAYPESAAGGNGAADEKSRSDIAAGQRNRSDIAAVERNRSDIAAVERNRSDIAAAVQAAIVDVLVAKAVAAVQMTGVRELVVAGGVGANQRLRDALSERASRDGFRVYYPPLEYCTDNGAMIALAGALRLSASSEYSSPAGCLRLSAGSLGEAASAAGALRLSTSSEYLKSAGAVKLITSGENSNSSDSLTPKANDGDKPSRSLASTGNASSNEPDANPNEAPSNTYAFSVAPRWDLASLKPVSQ